MAHQVFICHSSRDKTVADAACAALEAQRISCWVAPRDVLAGMEYGSAIMEALAECQIVLLIFSKMANDSPQVRREIERAVSKEKIILPFRIENVLPSNAMEYALGNTHWLDAITPSMERHLADLCQTVSRLIERQHPAEPLWHPDMTPAKRVDSDSAGTGASIPPPPTRPVEPGKASPHQSATAPSSHTAAEASAYRAADTSPYKVPDGSPEVASRNKTWIWAGGVAGLVLLVITVIAGRSSGPRDTPIQEGAAVGGSVAEAAQGTGTPTIAAATVVSAPTPGQSVAEMEMQEQQLYRDQNFGSAFPLAKGACDGGVAAACNHAGVMYARGRGTIQDEAEAVAMYRKACDGGEAGGCTNLGYMYQNGKGIGQDAAQALLFYGKGCDGNYAIGCTALGDIYKKGNGAAVDEERAAAFYRKGCDGGNAIGCASLRAMNRN